MLPAIAVLALSLALPSSPLPARDEGAGAVDADVSPTTTLDTLVVTGTLPGPGLWQVSKGDNTLWILATVSPMPKDITWDSAQVDELLARADEVLAPGGGSLTLGVGGMFKLMTLAPSAIAASKNPDRKTLQDVLPAEIHRQWAELKDKYIGTDRKVERRRPMIAAMELHSRAVQRSGMTRVATVWNHVSMLAEQHGVPITATGHDVRLSIKRKEAKAGIKAFADSRGADIECMSATLDTLERDLAAMRRGANAWATGDLSVLRLIEHDDLQPACRRVQEEAMGFMGLPEMEQQAYDRWLEKAESALSRNRTTVAVVSVARLLEPTAGLLTTFRERGYTVVEPDTEFDDGPGPDGALDPSPALSAAQGRAAR